MNVLRNALLEGTGLSQLKSIQETETGQQYRTMGDTDPSNQTASLSANEAHASEQQAGEEAEGNTDQYESHRNPPPSENLLLDVDSGAQETQSHLIKDILHEENDLAKPLLGDDSSPYQLGISGGLSSEVAASEKSPESTQPLVSDSELQKPERSIMDDGDFIDYEGLAEEEGGTSSASSTLQGDTLNIYAVQDHEPSNKPTVAQSQARQCPHNVQGDVGADERALDEYLDDNDARKVGVSVGEVQSYAAEIASQDSDDRSISGQFNEEEALENNQATSISKGTGSQLKANADDQRRASADHAQSNWQDTLHGHEEQPEGDAYPVADGDFNDGVEESSPTHSSYSVNESEAKAELVEADSFLAHDDNDHIFQRSGEAIIQPSLFVDESAQIHEDDDEITYEDEEYDIDAIHNQSQESHSIAISPGSLKRARSYHEDDEIIEENAQGQSLDFLMRDFDKLTTLDRC